MMNKLAGWDDTIVALATAPSVAAIGVIRLSGPAAIAIANALFPAKDLSAQPSHTLHVGWLKEGGEQLDEVVVSLFRGPRSYTGEDVVEFSCHGSPYVQQRVIDASIKLGARLARPGEFTQRAFLQGKLDLAQAEAVADLIASNTAAAQKAALHTMKGGFSGDLSALRERLIRFSALIELELDFSQEDVEFADRSQFYALIDELQMAVDRLVESFSLGNVIRQGVNVAIVGKPNAGKSTLLNSLLNENRAIVSDIPGTTRDTIEEVLNMEGILFRLIDTAGIREHSVDVIEQEGIVRSIEKMKQADLVLYLVDAEAGASEVAARCAELEAEGLAYLMVVNKIDRVGKEEVMKKMGKGQGRELFFISARLGEGLAELKRGMVEKVLAGRVQVEGTVVTNARHYHALVEVQRSLVEIRLGLDRGIPGDLLALDIRRCLHYLGEITGEISNNDQLDYIFSKFCIGK